MRNFRRYITLGLMMIFIFCSLSSCVKQKEESGNKIKVDNIHKGSGKYDRDTLYIIASNVNTSSNSAIIKHNMLNVGITDLNKRCFNPYFVESKCDSYIVNSIWEPLMKIGYDGEFYPNILKQLPTVSEDKKTYLFSLREDLLWEDGTKLTTQDINFTFKFLMDESYNGNFDREFLNIRGWKEYRDGNVNYVDGINIIDDYNFRVVLDTPTIYSLEMLNIYPISYTYYGQYYYQGGAKDLNSMDIRPFGNGIFKFLGYSQDEYLILEKNDFYFKGKSDIENLTYKVVDEKNSIKDLILGNIDIARDVLPNEKNIIETSEAQFLNGYIFNNCEYASIGINHTNEFLKDVSIRNALNLSIDKSKIVKNISNIDFNVIDVPIDKDYFNLYYDKDELKNSFNKNEAIKILTDLGWSKNKEGICEKDGNKLQFRMIVQKNDTMIQEIYSIIESNLKDIGVGLICDHVNINSFIDIGNLKNNYDLFLVSPNFTMHSIWIKEFFTNSVDNYYSYSNAILDEVLTSIATTFDIEKNKVLYHEAYRILKEDLPIIPLFQNKQFGVYNGRILGINSANMFKTFYYDEVILKK